MRSTITSGSPFEAMAGYSRAVLDGDWIFVSGTAGYDFKTNRISDDAAEQAEQALETIAEVLAQAQSSLADVVQLRLFLSDRAWVEPVSRLLRERFKDRELANTTIICTMAMPEMKIEIEVTALRRRP